MTLKTWEVDIRGAIKCRAPQDKIWVIKSWAN